MLITIREYFLLFMLYAMLGWLMEVVYALVTKKKLSNRGFLIGPYCPIYGVGILEYFTSYIMEKLFKARWWDYTKTKFNINGRICVDTMLPFGIIAVIIIYLVNPVIARGVEKTPDTVLTIIAITFLAVFILDLIASFNIVNNFKKTIKKASLDDRTDDINKYIRETLSSKSLLHRRLLRAFPTGHAIIKTVKKVEEKIEDAIEEIKKED